VSELSSKKSEKTIKLFQNEDVVAEYEEPLFDLRKRMYKDNTFFQVHEERPSSPISTVVLLFPTKFINEPDLCKWLMRLNVDVSKFGNGAAKTISCLLRELQLGESVLRIKEQNSLGSSSKHEVLRVMHVTNLVIFGPDDQTCLVEKQRVFLTSGKVQKKGKMPSIKMNTSCLPPIMSESKGVLKMAISCLHKELSFKRATPILRNSSTLSSVAYRTSESMPGIKGEYHVHQFRIKIIPESVGKFIIQRRGSVSRGAMEELMNLRHLINGTPFVTRELTAKGLVEHHWDWEPIDAVMDPAALKEMMDMGLKDRDGALP
jgi:hypothetical protein